MTSQDIQKIERTILTSKYSNFRRRLSEHDRVAFYTLLRYANATLSAHNITYFLYYGTLIGAYRSQDIAPWDDDLDIMVHRAERPRVRRLLTNTQYEVRKFDSSFDKMFPRNGKDTGRATKWLWPFLDIFYFRDSTRGPDYIDLSGSIQRRRVFPVHLRPFGPLQLYVPRDTGYTLRHMQRGLACNCFTRPYMHINDSQSRYLGRQTVHCAQLAPYFVFVSKRERVVRDDTPGLLETLNIAGKLVRRVFIRDAVAETIPGNFCIS